MEHRRYGRILMTAVLVVGAVLGFILDWRSNHLLNPTWVPHARFHGALLLFQMAGVSATGVWLLWRKSKEPLLAMKVAGLLAASFWTPFFFITSVLPGSSLWAGAPGTELHLGVHAFYPNVAVAGLFLTIIGAAIAMDRKVCD